MMFAGPVWGQSSEQSNEDLIVNNSLNEQSNLVVNSNESGIRSSIAPEH